MKTSDLFTRDKANAGHVANIPLPNGKLSDETLTIHHADCDAFRQKKADVLSSAAQIDPKMPDAERKKLRDAAMTDLLASLVSGWSLEDEFSHGAVVELLTNAPYLADWLNQKSEDTSLFFGNASTV
jgi:hypothetical protein